MTENKSSLQPDESAQGERVSATGMFQRAFTPAAATCADKGASDQGHGEILSAQGAAPVAGEFTRLFQAGRPASAGSPSPVSRAGGPKGEPSASEAGEFTRVFLGRSGDRGSDGGPRPPSEAGNAVRPRGFSSAGASESAAAEGGVTQLFRAPSATPAGRPESAVSRPAARDGELFRGAAAAPASAAPSITNLLDSLSMPSPPASEPRAVGPSRSPDPLRAETGGVTQFIQKLGVEAPPRPPEASPAPAPPPAPSGPGEYTRIVARLEEKPVAPPPAEAPAPRAALPGRPAMPAVPALPAIQAPPMPHPAASSPAAALPRKTKLEALAPVLLALNTVLLVTVLLLLTVLLRSR